MSAKKKDIQKNIHIKNRKASFHYEFLEKFVAGMVLKGTEIKSIRQSKVSFNDAHCIFVSETELVVRGLHISVYDEGTYNNHEPLRERKLLLQKKELKKLHLKLKDQGLTIVPTRMFITERGFAKMEVALAKGKKLFDKRHDLKEKAMKREMKG
ncbi:MAG: SsrA-binding protein SmpB [Cytophagales bacterium]|nr:SsrA-binding protein SmpB [Cytophagales bacterium]